MDVPNVDVAPVEAPEASGETVEPIIPDVNDETAEQGQADESEDKAPLSTYTELAKAQSEVRELRTSLVTSRIELEAARAGIEIDGLSPYLSMTRFMNSDGTPDRERIKEFIASLGVTSGKPEFTQDVFAGSGGSGGPARNSPESFRNMSKAQISEIAKRGDLWSLTR